MTRMRDLIILVENFLEPLEEARIDGLKKVYIPRLKKAMNSIAIPDSIRSSVTQSEGVTPEEKLFNWILNQDPGKNHPNSQWMLDRILKSTDPMPLEDVETARETLSQFEEMKRNKTLPRGASSDINTYPNLSAIDAVIHGGKKEIQQASDAETQRAEKESTLLYKGPDLTVVQPNTEFAACYWGQPTGWCTAWGNHLKLGLTRQGRYETRGNQFDYYNGQGPMQVIIVNSDPSERYQVHYALNQFMNVDDQRFNTAALADRFPILYKIFKKLAEQYKSLVFNENPSIETQIAAIKRNPRSILHMKNPPPELQLIAAKSQPSVAAKIHNPSEEVQIIAANAGIDSVRELVKNIGKDPSEAVQLAAVKKDGLSIGAFSNISEAVQLAAVKENGDAIVRIIRILGKLPSLAVQITAVESSYDAIEFIKNPDPRVQLAAIKSHEKYPDIVDEIANILGDKIDPQVKQYIDSRRR